MVLLKVELILAVACIFQIELNKIRIRTVFGSPAGSLCNHAVSVSRARFVTAGAIDPKLCTYLPLGKSNSVQS
jgi:hypothetical protein